MWRAREVAGAAALVLAGLAGGAWAGIDAATQVDARYRFAPAIRISRPVPEAVPRSNEVAVDESSVIAAPPAGSVWGQEIGRDERAFFDPTIGAEPPPVHVHRAPREEPLWSPPVDAPEASDSDGEDGSVDPRAVDAGQPEPAG